MSTLAAVHRSVTVKASVEKAFAVFTEAFTTWWPPTYQISPNGYEAAFIEPRLGGRWYQRCPDGSEQDWGTVLAWDPPHHVRLTWQIDAEWQYDPDPSHASEVDVTFTDEGNGLTRVDLVHSRFDQLAGAASLAETVGGENGWKTILSRFESAL